MDTACFAVDWGTTSFRLWALRRDGAAAAVERRGEGMAALAPGDYASTLERALTALSGGKAADPDIPVVVCGMAGAAQGWRNAPYLPLPATFADIAANAVVAPRIERDVRILPGLAQMTAAAPDVMRGEETLLLGADLSDGMVCLPGTHAKWVSLDQGRVVAFRTAMTGEVFDLLAERSTLSHYASCERTAEASFADSPAFEAGVLDGFAAGGDLLAAAFSVRAGPLLFGEAAAAGARARLSGLLIGAEIAALAPRRPATPICLVASGELARIYARALRIAGLPATAIDAEAAARRGLARCAAEIWSARFQATNGGSA